MAVNAAGDAEHAAQSDALDILVVDDDRSERLLLSRVLESEGHRVVEASSGERGVEAFEQGRFDIILMDMRLPGIDGIEATRRIKARSGVDSVPLMFLTGSDDERELAACLEAGGDDFMVKPWRPVVLWAKIQALLRSRDLHREVTAQRDLLEQHQARLIREQELAERLYSSMLGSADSEPREIQCLMSPASIFSGDVVFHAQTPAGAIRVLVGDFTGHGLEAAIGALPVNEIFRSMTEKGFAVSDLILELNHRLERILPTRMFFACAVVELVPGYDRLLVWNGGLPDVLITDANGSVQHRLVSSHLALGIQSNDRIDPHPQNVPIEIGERVYLFSDGIIEANDSNEGMFGQERLEAFLQEHASSQDLFADLSAALRRFSGDSEQLDDFTLVELRHDGVRRASTPEPVALRRATEPRHWGISVEFDPDILREVDPLPLLMQWVIDLQGLRAHREKIYMVLAELYFNALDHGLLGLDSSLKESPDGLSAYYGERAKRLAVLEEGRITISFRHEREGDGGCLRIIVEDSGPGFDIEAETRGLGGNVTKSGRGLALVRELTRDLHYERGGARAEARYVWSQADPLPSA